MEYIVPRRIRVDRSSLDGCADMLRSWRSPVSRCADYSVPIGREGEESETR
jgi:hypothetical protein